MTRQIIKESYIKDHLAKTYLKQPERRLRALDAIEALLRSQHPEYIDDPMRIYNMGKDKSKIQLAEMKGSNLSSAEKSIITGLFKYLSIQ